MFKTLCAVLLGFMVAGCATQRTQMTDSQYRDFAKAWAMLHHCNMSGVINGEVTAKGRAYLVSSMNSYSFDGKRMDNEAYLSIKSGNIPTNQDCRSLDSAIHSRKMQIDNQNAQASMQQQETQNMIRATKPTNTYCNKIGTQVLCNSF